MKKFIYTGFCLTLLVLLFQSFKPMKVMRRDGTDPGYTGSPGDTFKTCVTCHAGSTENQSGWITSTVPVTGYVPGNTYTVRVVNTRHGATRFGFEVSPQAYNGTLLGTMIITDTARTKLVGGNKYITYKSDGVDGVDSNIWVFDWVAPAIGTGNVTFYGAFNSNPGHKGGDVTTLSTLVVKEFGTSGIQSINNKVSNIQVYPNPVNGFVRISYDLKKTYESQIELTDMNGKRITTIQCGKQGGTVKKEISTADLPSGIYVLRITVDGKTVTEKIQVTH